MLTGNQDFMCASRFFCITRIIPLFLSLFFIPQTFASTLEFLIEEQGNSIKQSTQVVDDRVVIRKAGGDPTTDLLFDASNTILYVINHKDKSYMRIDNKVVTEISALMNTVSGVVGSQRNVFSDLLSTFGFGKKPKAAAQEKPKVNLADSGRDLNIGGAQCRLYQALRNQKLQAEACFAPSSALNLTAVEYDSLKKFAEFGNLLLTKAGGLLEVFGLEIPAVQMQSVPGVPIGMNDQVGQRKVKLVEINGIQGLEGMRVPDGYTATPIPFTSG